MAEKISKKTKLFFLTEVLILCTIIFTIDYFSDLNNDFLRKNNQINEMYDNWLILRSEVLSYLASETPKRGFSRDRLLWGFEKFDSSMVDIADEVVFEEMEKHFPHIRHIRQCLVYNWQKVQYQLAFILQQEKSLEEFTTLIIWMARDTQEMDRFFEVLKHLSLKANIRQQHESMIISYLVVIVLMILFTFALYRNFKIEQKLSEEAEIQKMTRALFKIRDAERKRIALDIHDCIVHRLRDVLKYAEQKLGGEEQRYIAGEINTLIDTSRDISFNLIPFITSDGSGEDFVNVIKAYAAEVLYPTYKLNFSAAGMNKIVMPEDMRINIFRIIQESLNNIVKYAEADTVSIKLVYSHPYVMFTVEDNGKGIPESRIVSDLSRSRIGMYGMRERVKIYGGTIKISSVVEKGTKISVRIPYRGENL